VRSFYNPGSIEACRVVGYWLPRRCEEVFFQGCWLRSQHLRPLSGVIDTSLHLKQKHNKLNRTQGIIGSTLLKSRPAK